MKIKFCEHHKYTIYIGGAKKKIPWMYCANCQTFTPNCVLD